MGELIPQQGSWATANRIPPSLHPTPHFLAQQTGESYLDNFNDAEQDTATQGNTTEDSSLQQTQLARVANLYRHENTLSNPALLVKNIALPNAKCHKCCTYPTSSAPKMA